MYINSAVEFDGGILREEDHRSASSTKNLDEVAV
jgi:hypothetical protein